MRQPCRDRRKRLEDLIESRHLPRIAVVPVTNDAPTLHETLVGGGSAEPIKWGDWGEAVMLHLTYKHPSHWQTSGDPPSGRIARQQPFELNVGSRASVVCWGVMPSGMLRYPLFLAWL